MSQEKTIIEARDVSIYYDRKPIFENIRYRFRARRVTGIIGPSGSGKTTLLRTFNRMNDRVEGFRLRGSIQVQGQEIYGNGVDVCRLRRNVGMVFQKPCIFPKSIYENAIFGLKRLQPERRKEFPDLAEQSLREAFLWDEVKDRLRQPGYALSQGQQQRLAIARALCVKPETLLMDEPTSALDPKSARAIEELIQSLKENHSILLVTHNLEQAKRVSDHVVFVSGGCICETGRAEDFFSNPECRETWEYLRHGG
ncbi:MAG: phosphate ABC transporter ATP-binding protein [Nitrospinales bacterium]